MTSGFILDTSVISRLAPGRSQVSGGFAEWIVTHQDRCHLSVMTITELERGIAKLKRLRNVAKAEALATWLDMVLSSYAARVLALDLDASRLAGRMIEDAVGRGHTPSLPDVLLASTAKRYSMVVLTLNLKDFVALDVQCQDPFAA